MSAEYSAYDFTRAITKAIAARDVKGAHSLLMLMAVHHPNEAEEIRDVMLLGLAMGSRRDADVTP